MGAMSDLFLVSGDAMFPAGKLAAWRVRTIGADEVGRLPKYVSGPQGDTTVKKLLALLQRVGKQEHVELELEGATVRLRALVSDHTLHDLAAPLVGAFRVASTLGARGELLFAIDSTPPSLVHRLRLGKDETLITVGAREAKTLGAHEGLIELRATLDGLRSMTAVKGPMKPRAAKRVTKEAKKGVASTAPSKPVPGHFAHVTPPRDLRPAPQAPPNADRTSPIASLRDVAIIQATQARVIEDPRAFYAEVAALFEGDRLYEKTREPVLLAISAVLGNGGNHGMICAAVHAEPRWMALFARLVGDGRVHPHFRAGAMVALAQPADPARLPLIVEHARIVDADTLKDVVYAYGAVALDALRGAVENDVFEEVELDVEDLLEEIGRTRNAPNKKKRR